MIKKAAQCKDKAGRTLAVGDEVIVRGKIVDLLMDLEDYGMAIVKVQWHGAVPLGNLVESRELEKASNASHKKPTKRRKIAGSLPPPEKG